jgi:hypothetical protein
MQVVNVAKLASGWNTISFVQYGHYFSYEWPWLAAVLAKTETMLLSCSSDNRDPTKSLSMSLSDDTLFCPVRGSLDFLKNYTQR